MRISDWSSDVCSSDLWCAERVDGAGDVEGHRRAGDPGGVGRIRARGEVCQRTVLELGADLLDDRVVTVTFVGLDGGQGRDRDEHMMSSEERRVGKECVSKREPRRAPCQQTKKYANTRQKQNDAQSNI